FFPTEALVRDLVVQLGQAELNLGGPRGIVGMNLEKLAIARDRLRSQRASLGRMTLDLRGVAIRERLFPGPGLDRQEQREALLGGLVRFAVAASQSFELGQRRRLGLVLSAPRW